MGCFNSRVRLDDDDDENVRPSERGPLLGEYGGAIDAQPGDDEYFAAGKEHAMGDPRSALDLTPQEQRTLHRIVTDAAATLIDIGAVSTAVAQTLDHQQQRRHHGDVDEVEERAADYRRQLSTLSTASTSRRTSKRQSMMANAASDHHRRSWTLPSGSASAAPRSTSATVGTATSSTASATLNTNTTTPSILTLDRRQRDDDARVLQAITANVHRALGEMRVQDVGPFMAALPV